MFIPDHFKINPFQKHIFKIEQIMCLISDRKSVGGLNIDFELTNAELQNVEHAIKLLSDAVEVLKKLDKRKELLR